jgi:hypothetical protein
MTRLEEARSLASLLPKLGTLGPCYETTLLLALTAVVEEQAAAIAELRQEGLRLAVARRGAFW